MTMFVKNLAIDISSTSCQILLKFCILKYNDRRDILFMIQFERKSVLIFKVTNF